MPKSLQQNVPKETLVVGNFGKNRESAGLPPRFHCNQLQHIPKLEKYHRLLKSRKMHIFLIFLITSLCTIAIDVLWIGFIAKNTLINLIKPYLSFDASGSMITRVPYAIACWLLIVAGVYLFVIQTMPKDASLLDTFAKGALFGAITYGVYDLTNAALQIEWPALMIVLDVGWGMFLCGVCALFWRYFLQNLA